MARRRVVAITRWSLMRSLYNDRIPAPRVLQTLGAGIGSIPRPIAFCPVRSYSLGPGCACQLADFHGGFGVSLILF